MAGHQTNAGGIKPGSGWYYTTIPKGEGLQMKKLENEVWMAVWNSLSRRNLRVKCEGQVLA